MNYRQKHNKKFPWIIVPLLFIIGIIAFQPAFPERIRTIVFQIGEPIWGVTSSAQVAASDALSGTRSKQFLLEEIERLETELEKVRIEQLTNDLLREENRVLRERYERGETESPEVMVSILKRPRSTLYDTFIVDGGSAAGIKKDSLVISSGGVAVGTITEVFEHSALVTLFSSPGSSLDVLLGTDDSSIALSATGKGSGNFEVLIPRDIALSVGDPVVLPTLSPTLLATVDHIGILPTDPFKEVLFRLPINISEERFLFIKPYVQN